MPSVLSSPRLRRILAAYTVNRFGTWFGVVALSVAVFDHTHSAVAVAALLVSAQVLPAFVVPALVARVEASARRSELSGLYIFEGVATAALAVLLGHFWLPAILLLVALDGTAALTANALLRAALARAAREESQEGDGSGRASEDREADAHAAEAKANAALNIAFSATFMLGPAVGGIVVAGAGAPAALWIDAASFLICGSMLIDLHPHVEEAGTTSVRARMQAAWQHLRRAPALRRLLITEAAALVFFASGAPIEVAYAKATLHAGDSGYGVLLAFWGVGTVVGSIVFARAGGQALPAMLTGGTLAVGLAYVGFSIAPSIRVACIAAILGGVGNGVQWGSLIGAVQQLTPPALHGRMMGAVESMGSLSPAIGLSLGGILTALTSPRTAFLIVGAGAACMTVAFVRLAALGISLRSLDASPGESP